MRKNTVLIFTLTFLFCQPCISDQCHYELYFDINADCRIDFYDFAQFAAVWLLDCNLDPNDPNCIPMDIDGDGYDVSADCNDDDPNIYPDANELCDGLDNDCDGSIDEDFNLMSDSNNCGYCGNICASGYTCQSGECTHVPMTDYVFIIDAGGSMAAEIAAVKNGLNALIDEVQSQGVDARYSIVLFGGAHELVLDWTSNGNNVITAFNTISVTGAVTGFQQDHTPNPEASFEAVRIVLNSAVNNTLIRTNVGGSGPLVFRENAQKAIILITDEDSDQPYYAANRYPDQTTMEPPYPFPTSPTNGWFKEVVDTANAVINNDASIYLAINHNDTPSAYQFGHPYLQIQDADFSNFDATATLNQLIVNGYSECLQAKLLQAGKTARVINILDFANPGIAENFLIITVE